MTDRVLIQGGSNSVMRVSLPGYDVNTATLAQLAFDARFANRAIYLRGSISFNPSSGGLSRDVLFGETLAAPPIGFCYTNGGQAPFTSYYNFNDPKLQNQGVTTKLDRATFFTFFPFNFTITFFYLIFKPLGA